MFGRSPIKNLILIFALLCLPKILWAYSDTVTHPGLAGVTAEIYNKNFSVKLTETDKKQIIQGSIDEDKVPRMSNHFYDPIHNIGWNHYSSSIAWSNGSYADNLYSWPKAIEYYSEGKKDLAMLSLGHLLHLLEDMTVPDHTRNDTHLPMFGGSVFENWVENNYSSAEVINKFSNLNFFNTWKFDNFSDYLTSLAIYSNANYFSNHTLDKKVFSKPEITYEDKEFLYGRDDFFNDDHKLLLKKELNGSNSVLNYYLLDPESKNPAVLSDYFDRLAKQAVLAGVNVIDLFLTQAEQARAIFLEKQKQAELAQKLEQDKRAETYKDSNLFGHLFADIKYGTQDAVSNIITNTESIYDNAKLAGTWLGHNVYLVVPAMYYTTASVESSISSVADRALASVFYSGSKMENNTQINPVVELAVDKTAQKNISNTENQEVTFSQSEVLAFIEAFKKAVSNQTETLQRNGVGSFVEQNKNFVSGAEPNIYIGSSGTNIYINIGADTSSTTTQDSEIIKPDISLIDDPCSQSIAIDGCLLLSTTTTIYWQSTSTDIAYFALNLNGVVSTTTATSTIISLADNQEYNFSVSSVAFTGTSSLPVSRKLLHKTLPIAINEINWSGTIASIDDQWIELKNNTDYTIVLDNFKVVNSSSTLVIPIQGTIKPNDYFVLEKKSASSTEPIKDLTSHDWQEWNGWLSMSGEDLYLVYSKDGLEKVIDYVPYCENWCNLGQVGESLERYDSEIVTSDLSSDWSGYSYYDYDIKNGLDREDGDIYGTPGQRNGYSYLINKGQDITGEVILKDNLTYMTQSDLYVAENGSLKAGPGTVIKLRSGTSAYLFGKTNIRGNEGNPAVITSWTEGVLFKGINLYGSASGSSFNNLKIQNTKKGILGDGVKDLTFNNIEYSDSGNFQSNLINFSNSNAKISNLTGINLNGGLAHFENNSSVDFENIHINSELNSLESILSVYKNSEAKIDGLEVKNNFCLFSCISVYGDSRLSIDNSFFDGFSSDFGSAVDIYDYSHADIRNTKFLNGNNAVFVSDNGNSEIYDSEFQNINYSAVTSTRGGEVLGQRLNIHDNKIGVFSYYNLESTTTIADSLFWNNTLAVSKGLSPGLTDDLDWLQDEQGQDELKYPMNFKSNWWGDPSGPKHEVLNSEGKGDLVSNGVEFDPWYADYNTKELITKIPLEPTSESLTEQEKTNASTTEMTADDTATTTKNIIEETSTSSDALPI